MPEDFAGKDLSGFDLIGADLTGANLTGVFWIWLYWCDSRIAGPSPEALDKLNIVVYLLGILATNR